jgi:hypothetical protein
MDEFLKNLGYNYSYDQLTPDERKQVDTWYDQLAQSKLTLEDVKGHITAMREAVENELTKPDVEPKTDIFLKARLRNYMLIESLLHSPERAKKAVERSMGKRT